MKGWSSEGPGPRGSSDTVNKGGNSFSGKFFSPERRRECQKDGRRTNGPLLRGRLKRKEGEATSLIRKSAYGPLNKRKKKLPLI